MEIFLLSSILREKRNIIRQEKKDLEVREKHSNNKI